MEAPPSRPRAAEPVLLGVAAVALLVGAALMPLASATGDCVSLAMGLTAAAIAWRWQTAGYPAFVHRGRRVDPAIDPRRRRSRRALGVLSVATLVAAAIDRPGAGEGIGAGNNISPFVAALWGLYGLVLTLAVALSGVRSAALIRKLLRAPPRSGDGANATWGASLGDVRGVSMGASGAAMAILTEEVADLTMPTLVRENVLSGDVFRIELPDGDAHVNPAGAYWASDVRLYPMTRTDERVQLVRTEMIPDGARVLVTGVLRGQSGFGGRRLEGSPEAPLAIFASQPGSDPRAILQRKVVLRRVIIGLLFTTVLVTGVTHLVLRPRLPPVHSPWAQ